MRPLRFSINVTLDGCCDPKLVGHGPTLFSGLSKPVDLKLVDRVELGSGAVAMQYQRVR
jgi:hypothetical protein